MIFCLSVHPQPCSRSRRVDSSKITTFDAVIREESLYPPTRNFVTIRFFAAVHGENFVILICIDLTQYSSVTDIRTDERWPLRQLRRAKRYS